MPSPVQIKAPAKATTVSIRGFTRLLTDVLSEALARMGIAVVDGEVGPSSRIPDVVLVAMPRQDDEDKHLNDLPPGARVLMVGHGAPGRPSRSTGVHRAAEWLSDQATLPELVATVRGGSAKVRSAPGPHHSPPGSLTAREIDVVELVAGGGTDEDVAARLGISVHTVRAHLQHVRDKLQVATRFAAVAALRESGLLCSARVETASAAAEPPRS